jgi:inner membrane protein
MDSLTHLAAGACIGEVFLGRQLGQRALLWGAVAQSAPDIDALSVLWTGPAEHLLAHRGFTHSFLFAAMIVPLFALAAHRWHRPHDIPFRRFLWFFGVAVLGHTLLDGLNAYGTGWFEPFSHARIALNVLFVADPFFAVGVAVATVALVVMRRHNTHRRRWAWAGLVWTVLYTGHCAYNRMTVDREVRRLLAQQQVRYSRVFITPTVMNAWLWYVVAEDADGYHIGYRSVFDRADTLPLHFVPRHAELLQQVHDQADLALLTRFAQGWYTVEQRGDDLLFNDLRFGQVMGWRDPRASFVFRYHLLDPEGNELVVQRGRFAGWDRQALASLVHRIRGQ